VKVLSGILWAVAGLLGLLALLLLVRQLPSSGGWCVLRDEMIACDSIRVWTTLVIEIGAGLGVLAALLWHNANKRVPGTVHLQHLPTSSPDKAAEWNELAQELKKYARNKGRHPKRNPLSQGDWNELAQELKKYARNKGRHPKRNPLSQGDYSERREVPPMPRGMPMQWSTEPQHALPPAP
jgi:hypothetical protein